MYRIGSYKAGRPVHIVDGSRTPFLKARGKPGPFRASDLAVAAGRALLLRQPFRPEDLDEVILGCVIPRPDEANIARIVSLRLGCGKHVPAWTVQRNCGSGMQALDAAATNIACGRSDLVLAGGAEAMSHAPVLINDAMLNILGKWNHTQSIAKKISLLASLRPAHFRPVIGLLHGLTDPIVGLSMGQTAENLAHRFQISRERMDAYAVESHHRLARAQDEKQLAEITAIYADDGTFFDRDEGVRHDTSMSALARLKPVFDRPFGLVTAGNSAQVTDGAAWMILASNEAVEKYRLPVAGSIIDCAWVGVEPGQMGLGPVHAISQVLKRQRLGVGDIDYWEINEAFAAQVLACLEAWQSPEYCRVELGFDSPPAVIDPDRLNVDGGAVAIGHPVGASGARIVLHLLSIMGRNHARRGMASLCVGGGQGGAMLIQRNGEVAGGI
jgi:acetyl-CoA C-acetyltransferase